MTSKSTIKFIPDLGTMDMHNDGYFEYPSISYIDDVYSEVYSLNMKTYGIFLSAEIDHFSDKIYQYQEIDHFSDKIYLYQEIDRANEIYRFDYNCDKYITISSIEYCSDIGTNFSDSYIADHYEKGYDY